MENIRSFDLGTIITLTSDRIYTSFDNLYDILNYLIGDDIYTYQIPRVGEVAKEYVLSIYPQLRGIGVDEDITCEEDAIDFINRQKVKFGEELPIRPFSDSINYEYIDPIEEAIRLKNGIVRVAITPPFRCMK